MRRGPDGDPSGVHVAATVTIGPCQGCGACLLTCPEHAIWPSGGTLVVLPGRCTGCGECIEVCPVDAISQEPVDAGQRWPVGSWCASTEGAAMNRTVHPIERLSYEILRSRIDTSGLPPLTRLVTERVIHASADLEYLTSLVCAEGVLADGAAALAAGAAVVTDSEMTASGITARPAICRVRDPRAAALAVEAGITRSAAGIRIALDEVGPGAVWVIGTAPTALIELIGLAAAPALVVGLPVGFVGAAESKQALRDSGLPAVSNRGEKGGAAVAAAAVNALLYEEVTAP